MRKFFAGLFAVMLMSTGAVANMAGAAGDMDTADPLYLVGRGHVLSQTTLTYWDDILRGGQMLSYGVNESLVLGASVHYQEDFSGGNDGFSSVDLGGVYRLGVASSNDYGIISDVLFGLKVGGSSHVRTPDYANSTYYAGLRIGRKLDALTLAMTVKSSWIFDDTRGMAFIDFVPEAYFKVHPNWRFGLNATLRKATNPDYDQQWIGAKLIRQYGRTQYIGRVDYEFESNDTQVGLGINILF